MLKLIKFFRCHNSQTLMKKLTEGDMQERGDISNNGKQTDLKKKRTRTTYQLSMISQNYNN